jgi:GntR family transcriptional regulator/MocR family aminotransferase
MRDSLFHIERLESTTLQNQICERMVSAVLSGQLPPGAPVPSTRALSKRLKVSRNTVMLAYQALAADGYLTARERSGFFVSDGVRDGLVDPPRDRAEREDRGTVDWNRKVPARPSIQANIRKPENWHDYPYPFIYGQVDEGLFPIADWRDCARQAMSRKWQDAWTDDRFEEDDPTLVSQIRQRVLTRRGIIADQDEILITMGAQNALYLLASLLVRPGTTVAAEDPGYPDMRNILALAGASIAPLPVDDQGARVDALGEADLAFVTPSHQFPTNATMSLARRRALLDWAEERDALIIEDDYEFETNYRGGPTPALKSLDRTGRVLYVGSLSKSLMPGLRMGFLVAPRPLIQEARALRRLILRHPPGNNQRTVALFLALGRHDALIARMHRAYSARWEVMGAALERHFPRWTTAPSFGGTSYWMRGPDGFDARGLAAEALTEGVVIEPGDVLFLDPAEGRRYFRLGFSSIKEDRIPEGIARLAKVADRMLA